MYITQGKTTATWSPDTKASATAATRETLTGKPITIKGACHLRHPITPPKYAYSRMVKLYKVTGKKYNRARNQASALSGCSTYGSKVREQRYTAATKDRPG